MKEMKETVVFLSLRRITYTKHFGLQLRGDKARLSCAQLDPSCKVYVYNILEQEERKEEKLL